MIQIRTSANPDGSYIKHPKGKGFDPSFKAVFTKNGHCIPITNQPKKGGVNHVDGQESALKKANGRHERKEITREP